MRRVAWSGVLSVLVLVGCGGDGSDPSGPRECANACACADRGPPDFSRENTGVASESADEATRTALVRTNHWRTAAGLPAINGNALLEAAARGHSTFMSANASTCWPGAHNQTNAATCMGFTGQNPGARISREMYAFSTWGEVINWNPTPISSIDGWIWTVYHRQPFTSNEFTEAGFAAVRGAPGSRFSMHNTMDFARPRGAAAHAQTGVVIFPPPGTTDVPRGFQGNLEGPTPPVPVSTRRWPSGTVITLDFPTSTHAIMVHNLYDSDCAPVTHSYFAGRIRAEQMNAGITIDPVLQSRNNTTFEFMYADAALSPSADYYVEVEGTVDGQPWRKVWQFRTGR